MRRERLHQKYASAVSHGSRFSPAIAAIIARNHRQVIVLPFCRIQSLARDKLAQTQLDPFPSPSTGPILLSKNYPQTPFIVSPCYRFTISFRSYFSTIYSPCKKVFDYERSGCVSDQRSVFEHRPLPCDLAHFDRDFYLEPSGLGPLPVTRLFVEIFFRPLFTRLSKRPARVASARVSWFHGQFVPTHSTYPSWKEEVRGITEGVCYDRATTPGDASCPVTCREIACYPKISLLRHP